MLVAVPVGLYLFLYQRSRIEAATIRNFRALDAAAERVDQVLTRLSSVVVGSSFGVSPAVLTEVTKLLTDGNATPSGCGGNRGIVSSSWDAPPAFPRAPFRSRRPTAAQRLEFRYWRAADTLFKSNESNGGATEALWNQLRCLIDTHRKFIEPSETVKVNVVPVPRTALRPPAWCDDWTANSPCIRLRELLDAAPCPDSSAGSARLSAGGDGMAATVADCRGIEERYDDLHRALNSFVGADSVIHALDFFGTRSAADLDQLMNEATGYLSQFFDSHLIADTDGLILFEADTASASTPAAENQAATPGFSRYVDISELLRTESSRSGWPWAGDADAGAAAPSASFFRGRSFMRVVGVGDIGLRVFVHPFILDGVAVSDGAQRDARAGADLRPTRPTFYLVGIVDDREFRNAAMRLRLERVTSATLVLLGLLSFIPLMWYWTAGERAVVGRFALLAVCVLPAVGMVLFTVLACGLVTNRADEHALDGAMAHLSARIVDLFDQELGAEIDRLQRDVPDLMARARREELRPRRTKTRLSVAVADERRLTRLEQAFYCDDADRNLDYDPGRPEAWSAFLLNTEGRQQVCLSEPRRGRPARTPPLDLQFREYFRHPRDGALWRSPGRAQRQRVRCRIGDRQDAESFVPCLVDALPELSKRLFLVPGATGPGVPYFLERIDSVIGGGRTSILAVNTKFTKTPVAVAAISLSTLDRMVPPQHIDFAVVDRKTGRTLFHSDDDLAMTTNFVEVAGGDSALRSLLSSGTSDTVGLDYAGVPIRAHVRPLRPGMPWTLIVYRGHDLEDRLNALTTALAIFFALACLVLVILLPAGLALLAGHWFEPGWRRTVPAVLGRVITATSHLRGLVVFPVGLAVAWLLSTAWLSWLAWSRDGGRWVLPFLAVSALLAIGAVVVHCALTARASMARDPGDAGASWRRVRGLAVLIAVATVLPAVLWFGHHRAALGVALEHYLVNATLDSVARAREEYRLDMLRQHGAPSAPIGDRMRRRWRDQPHVEPGWVHRTLRPMMASSALTNQLMLYRALPSRRAGGGESLHDVFADTLGYDIDPPPSPLSAPDFGRFLVAAVGLLFFPALIAAHAYTICAACTLAGRHRRDLVKLPNEEALLRHAKASSRPLRAIVVDGGERGRDAFLASLEKTRGLSRHDHRVARRAAGGSGYVVRWTSKVVTAKHRAFYVFDDLREVLDNDGGGRALLTELEEKVKDRSNVLIWSRVVPDYRYSDRTGSSDRWFNQGHSDDAGRRDRWGRLAGRFDAYVLEGSVPPGKCIRADPACTLDDCACILDEECRNSAASSFNRVWAESTHAEQLVLHALARGGGLHAGQAAALSSLVTRGIVKEDPATGVVDFRNLAFCKFVEHDIDHHELAAWRKAGGGGGWRFIWPPLAIGSVLGLVFLAMANPEMRVTLLGLLPALLGLAPAVLPLLGGRPDGSTGTASGSDA